MVAQPFSSARAWSADPRGHELLRSPAVQQEAMALLRRGRSVRHQVEFTGTGKAYFGIWLSNLLLLILTLGWYYPWAKARKLRFFYGHTRIAGHPLAFHGEPRKMLRGFALTVVLMAVYSYANRVPGIASIVATLIMALIWPAIMRASLQFKLANSSWRGLRFKFTGTLAGAYKVVLLPMAVTVGLMFLSFLIGVLLPGALKPLAVLPAAIGVVAMVPYVWWHLKAYQHANYALGSLHTEFRGRYKDMVGIFVKASLLGVVSLLLSAALLLLVKSAFMPPAQGKAALAQWLALLLPGMLLTVVLVQLIQVPYFKARMQNLIWSQTGNSQIRFKSHLEPQNLMRVSLKNIGLTLITFGLYWPFAAVALARTQLESIVVHGRQDLTHIIRELRTTGTMNDAAGDAAADLMGLDLGL
jgi:uncharacterized membrane protein YjgN (DUF898 family)